MTASPQFDIRQVSPADEAGFLLGEYAFTSTPRTLSEEDIARRQAGRDADRMFMSYVNDQAVAKVNVIPMSTNVRGVVVPMGGVSGVASMPAARRGGHIRELLNLAIKDMHDQGEAVSALYPFKSSYYEKFGYAGWEAPRWMHISPAALAPYLKVPTRGEVRLRPSGEAIDDVALVLTRAQKSLHGMSLFGRQKQDAQLKFNKEWIVTVHEGDEVTAGLIYRMDLDKEHMIVLAVYWSSLDSQWSILDFMARHVDQIKSVQMPLVPGENPYQWATHDGSLDVITNDSQSWGPAMARIVSVAGLAGIGAGTGSVSLTISDEQAPWNNGTFTFTASEGRLLVHDGGEAAGNLTIHGLAALVFSGINARLLPVRGWGSVSDDAVTAVRELFPPVTPFIHTMF